MERRDALQQAIDEIRRQRLELEQLRRGTAEPIAVVGMACRFPSADSVEHYWRLLAGGGDAVTEVPRDRWRAEAFYDADPAALGKMATRQGGFVSGVDQFDPQFFGIAPREAQHMDPQQRLLLEVAWEALEDANIPPTDLYGSATGVFVGITCFDHAIRISRATEHFNAYAGTGSALNMAPGRLSYVLGLTGPSMAVDTACSSSLVCLHLACQSLRARESNAALVGGVHLILSPHVMVSFSQARMLAADGRSKTFDASADGYSRGEGCGVVVLKRLTDALAAGDTVLGVIRGTAVNQDGPSGGLTVPNGASQQQVIRRALEAAGVAPSAVSYVEAHGTGTSLGDPIEVEALARVYGEGRATDQPLLLGSVKTNIGHLEPAAGMASLIKVLLAFRHAELPRHLHFHTPNPHIAWADLPVKVVGDGAPWPRGATPRVAGISAFGFSGTNAHVVLEEPPPAQVTPSASSRPRLRVLPLSARTASALQALAARYREMLPGDDDADLAPVALTAGIGRVHFPHRLAILASTVGEARAALAAAAAGRSSADVRVGKAASADYRRDAAEVTTRLERAYAANDVNDVATLYLEGVVIDWPRLCGPQSPARAALPTYPFERQRYWIDTPDQDAGPAIEPWLYQLAWVDAGACGTDLARCRDRRWGIVADEPDLAGDLQKALAGGEAAVLTITPRDGAAANATDILFVCGASEAQTAAESCLRLHTLVTTLLATPGAMPRVWVVTRGALPVRGHMTEAGAAQAPITAFARVLGLEHPELFGRLIDVDGVRTASDAHHVLADVMSDDVEDLVALRSDGRFVQRVERVPAGGQTPPALRPDATYLVTGGLGRIGLLLAHDLVRRGARRLCLVSRRGMVTDAHRAAVTALKQLGATVSIAAADVADRAAMEALMRGLADGPPLAGVIHAAGLPGYRDIATLSHDDISNVMRPKVLGAWHLHEMTRDVPLDFFVCCSSIASAWGSRGQAHYAAGNAYLDALAHLRREAGLPAVTINWGPWADGGMTSPEAEQLLRRVGVRPLPTEPAAAALAALAQGTRPQVVVADIDLALFKGSYEARGHRRLLERLTLPADAPAAPVENALVDEIRRAAPDRRIGLLRDAVQREAAHVLELAAPSDADPDQGLFEMGMDSLMALELRARLQTLISRALPATLIFDYPTIHAIAGFLLQEIAAGTDPAPPGARAAVRAPEAVSADTMSEAEAEARLLKKLESIR